MEVIARIHTDFPDKFGIPRQSGLVPSLTARIVFEPKYRSPDAIKGIEEYSHLWLIWEFSKAKREHYSATVTPPRLGGKVRKGVFATRSPFRPNSMGLSSVRLEQVILDEPEGPVLVVSGADLLDGTPIFDIKPYLAYTDSHPDATGSFGEAHKDDRIAVVFPRELAGDMPEATYGTICDVLAQDPRAAYNKKPDYVYGMAFGTYDIRFVIEDDCLRVCEVVEAKAQNWKKIK
jgi:tRNA-Thr(GGU) m(6)t(6)A37 methyltransferase TsaA